MLLTCPAFKSELEGNYQACQSLPVKPEGSHPVCLPGEVQPEGKKDMNCLSWKAKLEGSRMICHSAEPEGSQQAEEEGNSPGVGLLQDVPEVPRAPQLQHSTQASLLQPQQSGHLARGSPIDDGSSQLTAGSASERHQAGVVLGPRQCPAGLLQGSDAIKRRCMPNWGRPSPAHTAPPTNADCTGRQTHTASEASTPAVLHTGAHHRVQDASGHSQQVTQEYHTLGCVSVAGHEQLGENLMQWHNHQLSTNAVRPLQLPTIYGASCQVQQPNAAIPDCRSAHGHGLLGIVSQICRSKDRVVPSALL